MFKTVNEAAQFYKDSDVWDGFHMLNTTRMIIRIGQDYYPVLCYFSDAEHNNESNCVIATGHSTMRIVPDNKISEWIPQENFDKHDVCGDIKQFRASIDIKCGQIDAIRRPIHD